MEEKKSRLEGKLKAIQSLKEEYYIGTRQALQYLQDINEVYERPKEIADEINKIAQLKKSAYKATPERIAGLSMALEGLSFYDSPRIAKKYENIFRRKLKTLLRNRKNREIYAEDIEKIYPSFLSGFKDLYRMTFDTFETIWERVLFQDNKRNEIRRKYGEPTDKDLISELGRAFQYAAITGVKSNKSFGRSMALFLSQQVGEREKVSPKSSDITRKIARMIRSEFAKYNWNIMTSKKWVEERAIKKVNERSISPETLAERILKDQIDHRLEYRRQILTQFLDINSIRNMEEGRRKLKKRIEWRKKRLAEYEKLRTPEEITKNEQVRLKELELILHCVVSDQNFIHRYLAN